MKIIKRTSCAMISKFVWEWQHTYRITNYDFIGATQLDYELSYDL